MISGGKLPDSLREHRLNKRNVNWTGFTECHLGADLLLVYRVRRESVTLPPHWHAPAVICSKEISEAPRFDAATPQAAKIDAISTMIACSSGTPA